MQLEEGKKVNPKILIIGIVAIIGIPIMIWLVFTYPMFLYGILLVIGMMVYAKLKNKGIIQ